ncbi:MAG TPA: divalent-cation tolerance protein CutA [Gemmatimonadales bacterium]
MTERDNTPITVLTTLESAEDARSFVRHLVERRIVACGTIVSGVRSVYRWEGDVIEAGEALVVLKTRRGRWPDLVEAAQHHHPYEVPELIALPIIEGLPTYLDWLDRETDASKEPA